MGVIGPHWFAGEDLENARPIPARCAGKLRDQLPSNRLEVNEAAAVKTLFGVRGEGSGS